MFPVLKKILFADRIKKCIKNEGKEKDEEDISLIGYDFLFG